VVAADAKEMIWMPWITLFVFALIAWGAPSWRSTALIITIVTAINIALLPVLITAVEVLPSEESGIIVPSILGPIDLLTAIFVLMWGSKGQLRQAKVLALAMFVHLLLLLAYVTGNDPNLPTIDLIYPVYEETIFIISIIQIYVMGGAYGELSGTFNIHRHVFGRWLRELAYRWSGLHIFGNQNQKVRAKAKRQEGRI
jgi:hypothetical protein